MHRIVDYWCHALDQLSDLVGSSSYAFSVWMLSSAMSVWGLWLALPLETYSASVTWEIMSSIAPSLTWGIVAIIIGLSRIHMLFQKKTISLAIFSLFAGYYWVGTGIAFLLSNPAVPTGALLIFLGLYEMWVYKRLSMKKR